ncbi:retrotransposon protein, putative, Ty1-copia subclass [Panicum miliaceum]|uniref:Retrotransposon protein, putative, Ty1-copia subclass n=1 Tax=Panicum miliaceum TaxID=4540 RepID=A0A3L6SWB3_PANMI|nr:retrotransposon protein, putative, Ty1-copia subclass [Panicum miliaceum]
MRMDCKPKREGSKKKRIPPSVRRPIVIAAIEQFSDLDTMQLEEAIGRLKAYEERIRKRDNRSEQQQLLLSSDSASGGAGRNYKKKPDRSKSMCYYCQELGHFAYERPEKKKKKEIVLLATASSDKEPTLL